jgi:ribosome-binding protein aMBF1 (putative translation factor)
MFALHLIVMVCTMPTKTMSDKDKRDKERFAKKVGAILQEARKKKGLTQEQLADKADFHRTYIGFMEQGVYSPNLYSLTKIAKALGVKLTDLLKKLD